MTVLLTESGETTAWKHSWKCRDHAQGITPRLLDNLTFERCSKGRGASSRVPGGLCSSPFLTMYVLSYSDSFGVASMYFFCSCSYFGFLDDLLHGRGVPHHELPFLLLFQHRVPVPESNLDRWELISRSSIGPKYVATSYIFIKESGHIVYPGGISSRRVSSVALA